jgi:peptidoglycan/xylan/chitin deacetylase (PgdA/CDA1 family)
MSKVFLTFDVEDFVWPNSMCFLKLLLSRLEKYDLKALFFITGHMAEKLKEQKHRKIVDMLCQHEIGYHSSSHSVHPAIYEFTDVESYEKAYQISSIRETSHINYLTGQIEGKGGILALRSLFSDNKIASFRAPGYCWSPPHSEALRDMGLKFDFYPFPDFSDCEGTLLHYRKFLSKAIKQPITILVLHPSIFVYEKHWDFVYYAGNPRFLTNPGPRAFSGFKSRFHDFEMFLKGVKCFRNMGLMETTPKLEEASSLYAPVNNVENIYESSVMWPRQFFNCEPKFLRSHFLRFFAAVP